MGLKADITSALHSELDTSLADANQTSITFVDVDAAGYDPATGTVTASETNHTVVYGVLSPLQANMIDGESFRVGDVVLLIFASDINHTPKTGDHFIIAGVTYEVNSVTSDPANVTYELYSRAV